MPAHQFLWFDIETTGLDPHKGRLLEFAAVLCEDSRGDDFAPVAQYHAAIAHPREAIEGLRRGGDIDDYVWGMHEASGLWAEVFASSTTLSETDDFLDSLAAELLGAKSRGIVLAGASVHFDLSWVRVWLPFFAARLSHRVFDVSTLRRAAQSWGPPGVAWPAGESAHRALPDVLGTISTARVARKAMGWS